MRSEFNSDFAVIDLETLAKGSNAVILSLGLTLSKYADKDKTFDELVNDGLYIKFDIKEQFDMNRTKEQSTIEWWYKQSVSAKQVLKPSSMDVSIRDVKSLMLDFFKRKGIDIKKVDFYDRNSFDLSKIQDVLENNLNDKIPWNYQYVFEISTMLRWLGYDRYAGMKVEDIPGATYHNALHDAAVDHLRILKVLHSENS